MPATEPALSALTANYPPSVGTALADLILRAPFWLALPITFNNADASVLYTVPTGQRMFIHKTAWEVTVGWTGGAASAIGVSTNDPFGNTKGDILGGAGGDVAALLVVADGATGGVLKGGTVGTKVTGTNVLCIRSGNVLRFDRITSAFTAGAGFVHVNASFVPAA